MAIIVNPHSAYVATASEVTEECDVGCVEKFIPKHLRENPLYEKVSQLMCYYENAWTDAELREYLTALEDFYRTGFGGLQLLNWYSVINWIEAGDFTWNDDVADTGFSDDFYNKYSLSTQDIWLSLSAANKEEFNEDGFKYYSWFLEPYIGTSLIQKKLLEKLEDTDGTLVDWYETGGIINSYSFQFDEFPGWEKAKVLIIGSKLLKNAESILLSLKDENCPNRFILSHSHLDTDYLSDITAMQFEGVTICFQRYESRSVSDLMDLFDVRKTYIKEHAKLIDYFIIRRLSVDFVLDELQENKIYATRTPERPGRFVQLMPAWMPFNNTWSAGVTWEDHYDWTSIIVTNLVRNSLDKERFPLTWTTADVWSRWIGWEGDPAEWIYNKPPANVEEYYVDRNFITGFEPETERSLYKVMIHSNKIRDFDPEANATSNRSTIVNYWVEETQMSENLFMDEPLTKVVYSQNTQEVV